MMRLAMTLLMVAGLGYLGYTVKHQNDQIRALQDDLAQARRESQQMRRQLAEFGVGEMPVEGLATTGAAAQVAQSARFVPTQNLVAQRVDCPACRSSGRIDPGNGRLTACRLCAGTGFKTIRKPAGADLCARCAGMGRTATVQGGRQTTDPCRLCNGQGWTR